MNNILTAWENDNPQWGHAEHLAIGWLFGLFWLAISLIIGPLGWLVYVLSGILMGLHEVSDTDLTGKHPLNGVCDILAFQPTLWSFKDPRVAVGLLLAYIIAMWLRGKNLNQTQGAVK